MMISRGLLSSQRRKHSVKVDSVSIVGTTMLKSSELYVGASGKGTVLYFLE
jgi:hypothetical protein